MLSISPKNKLLKKGEKLQLVVSTDIEGTPKYQSTNNFVATVTEEGVVEAIGVTTAYITASLLGPNGLESDVCRVDVAGLMLNPQELKQDIRVGNSIIISTLKKFPATAEVVTEVEDETIAAVSLAGATSFRIRGLKEGSTKVIFKLIDPEVEVTEEAPDDNVLDSIEFEITVGIINTLEFKQEKFEAEVGNEVTLPIEVDPTSSEYKMCSSNPEVFQPTELNKGNALSIGTAIVTAKKFEKSSQCVVSVKGLTVEVLGTVSTKHSTPTKVECSEKGKIPTFKSLTETIISVDQYGVVTGLEVGVGKLQVVCGAYTKEINIEVKKFFTPIDDLTDEIKKTIGIFTCQAEMVAYAKGRPIIQDSIMDGVIPISYIKTNEDPNLFEYELAILDRDLTRYNALSCNCSGGGSNPPTEKVTFTVTPNPSDAIVTINGTVGATIEVAKGTEVSYKVEKEGYVTKEGSQVVEQDTTVEITLEAEVVP